MNWPTNEELMDYAKNWSANAPENIVNHIYFGAACCRDLIKAKNPEQEIPWPEERRIDENA